MDFKEYIREIDRLYHVGNTTEHSFRGALESFLQTLLNNYVVTNEPRRIECGAPDYVITLKDVPVAFIEAKDINDNDLDGRREHKNQFNRYKESLNRIIFTDYLDFHMYIGGEFADSVRIAETRGDRIVGIPENEPKFTEMILHLATEGRQRITSSSTLARQMAAKAHLLAEVVAKTIAIDGEESDGEMATQLRAFRDVLIHDLKAEEFADIYAQTIVYGLFTARLNDFTPDDFSRQEAAKLIPKSNPFLRKIFQSIAGYDIDDSIEWIVDDLAAMFGATDAVKIMANYGSNKRHSDPIVHFYEDFLAEYDPRLRKARGVWYTPAPVVKFIVKSVDEILKTEFGLTMGLADSSTIKVKRVIQQSKDKRTADGMKHEEVDVHRVQVLDPATGTGTFLAEVIQQVRDKFDGMEGMWPSYVEKSLIPRIHGFEILMASYTIAHLKLALALKNTGYEHQSDRRLNVFLTNSLEEATPRATNLFAKWLSDEADAASLVKSETPIMIAIGNPPYSISSQNSGKWITNLVSDYKKNLNEKNIQPLSDDYIKFIRLGQHYIHKNGEGILAYISNNGFLDGIIHRQMRKSLLEEFDKIYILNLHGNSRRKEVAPDGTPDENVFDIMQGVSINIFVKTGKKEKDTDASVFYHDVYGSREKKYHLLNDASILSEDWQQVIPSEPFYFFVPKDFNLLEQYEKGFSLDKLFMTSTTGIKSSKDDVVVCSTYEQGRLLIDDLLNLNTEDFRRKYSAGDDSDGWSIGAAKDDVDSAKKNGFFSIVPILYRPFDTQFVPYTGKTNGVISRPRFKTMRHMLYPMNIALVIGRQGQAVGDMPWNIAFIVEGGNLVDLNVYYRGGGCVFPLYYYDTDSLDDKSVVLNLKQEIVNRVSEIIGNDLNHYEFIDYIYSILYSNKYRNVFSEFLKTDFPRIPYPKDAEQFHRLAEKGAQLRKLHLMKESASWKTGVSFPITGTNIVESLTFSDGKVYINKEQFFGNVSELAWNFYIGGYQPAQKWLKDRKGRTLDFQDILHYGHIIYALQETDRIMKEIDEIL